jgi:hypothetical protein
MKRHGNCAVPLAVGLCVLASAQAAAPQYQDRYINGGSLPPDVAGDEDQAFDASGLSRSLQIDGVVGAIATRGGGSSNNVQEDGIVAKAQWETADFGSWSLDASGRTGGSNLGPSEQGEGGTVTLRQRGMPFDGGWQADNAAGDLNAPDIAMARVQPRFYLPTGTVQGFDTEWHGPSGLQLVAGGGVPGLYDGIVVPNFHTLGGSTATAGAQWSPASQWTVGGQVIEAHDVNLALGPTIDGNTLLSSSTELLTAAWQDHGDRLQFNILDGDVNGKPNSVGGWIDGSMLQGRIQQNAGLFRIDPNLTWGNQLITNDAQGGYYRLDYQGRRWLADAGIDEVRSVSAGGVNTTFLTGDARYQWSRDWGIGGVANASRFEGGTSWSVEGFVDQVNRWGTGRVQVDAARTTTGKDDTLTLDQTWSTPAGLRLSTSGWLESTAGADPYGLQENSTLLGVAAYGGGQLGSRFGMEGNVRWAAVVQGRAAPGVSANVALTWQLSRSWTLLATYYDSRVGSFVPLTVVSPLTPTIAPVPALQERGVFLTFRYQHSSGLHFAPLGGAPGGGSGEITGIVYLDANCNGRVDAGEAGAANVTVMLDGRFSVQSDANGRFHFPSVATGRHVITVASDNLPLPWILVNEGRTEVEVTTRDRIDISIAAQRPR